MKKNIHRFDAMNSSGRIYSKDLWADLDKPMELSFDINTKSKRLQEKLIKMSPEELKNFLDETKSESLNKIVEQFAQDIEKKSVYKTVREVENA